MDKMVHPKLKKRDSSLPVVQRRLTEDLPKHVLQRAFRYFSDPTPEIRELSKDWTSVSEYPFIWVNLVFRGDKTSTDAICHILQNAPMLKSLKLVRVPEVVVILRQLCRSRHRLKHLAVRFCCSGGDEYHLVSIPESTLRNVIQSCPLLISLDLEGTPFYGKLFYEELLYLRRLRTLRLGCNSLLRPRNIQTVASVCRGRLTHFALTQCPEGPPKTVKIFEPALPTSYRQMKSEGRRLRESPGPVTPEPLPLTSADCDFLLKMLGPDLIVLELDAAGVESWALQGLLVDCPGLRCLRLLNAKNLPGELVRGIPSAMPRLTHLMLRGATLIGDEDLLELLEKGRSSKEGEPCPEGVSGLDLGGVGVAGEGAPGEAEAEKQWWEWGFWSDKEDDDSDVGPETAREGPRKDREEEEEMITKSPIECMHTLDVSMCPSVSDAFLHSLGRSPAADHLQRLGLGGCRRITDDGLRSLKSCTKLRHLDVAFVNGGRGPSPCWLKTAANVHLPGLQTLVVGWPSRGGQGERVEWMEAVAELTAKSRSLRVKRRVSCYRNRVVEIS